MRIAVIIDRPAAAGGLEISAWRSARALHQAGHDLFLVSRQYPDAECTKVPAERLQPYCDWLQLTALFEPGPQRSAADERMRQWLGRHDIDLIHMHDRSTFRLAGGFGGRWPVVTTMHIAMCPNGARYRWYSRRACSLPANVANCGWGALTDGCAHTGDGTPHSIAGFGRAIARDYRGRGQLHQGTVIAPSRWLAHRLAEDGMDPSRITVLPGAVDPVPVTDEGLRRPPQVLVTGRLVSLKGVDHAIRAVAGIAGVRLVVAGDGVERPRLEALAATLGIADRCDFVGWIETAHLDELRARSGVLVLPTLAPENLALAGQEALTAGLPAVAYDVGGNSDWCRHEETGLLVPEGDVRHLRDALARVLGDRALARRLGNSGRRLAQSWTPARHAEQLTTLYTSLLQRT